MEGVLDALDEFCLSLSFSLCVLCTHRLIMSTAIRLLLISCLLFLSFHH